jgi:hypothetical protein
MPLIEIELEMTRVVVARFMNLKESTNRKELVTKFKSFEAVDRSLRVGAMRTVDNDGDLAPLSLGVEYSSDEDALIRSKKALTIVIHALQNLYEAAPPRIQVVADGKSGDGQHFFARVCIHRCALRKRSAEVLHIGRPRGNHPSVRLDYMEPYDFSAFILGVVKDTEISNPQARGSLDVYAALRFPVARAVIFIPHQGVPVFINDRLLRKIGLRHSRSMCFHVAGTLNSGLWRRAFRFFRRPGGRRLT